MNSNKKKLSNHIRRKKRIRAIINGSSDRPRLSVFRSSKHIYVQAIDDINKVTVCSASTMEKGNLDSITNKSKIEQAEAIGKQLAEKLSKLGLNKAVFDRNGYIYHGRVKKLADAIREGGIKI